MRAGYAAYSQFSDGRHQELGAPILASNLSAAYNSSPSDARGCWRLPFFPFPGLPAEEVVASFGSELIFLYVLRPALRIYDEQRSEIDESEKGKIQEASDVSRPTTRKPLPGSAFN
jgi:hypothetical protein